MLRRPVSGPFARIRIWIWLAGACAPLGIHLVLHAAQAGRQAGGLPEVDLLTLVQEETPRGQGLRRIKIRSRPAWEWKRKEIVSRLLHLMGPFPSTGAALNPAAEGEEALEQYTRRKIRYSSGTGDQITAWLLSPPRKKGRLPAVLALHPTAPGGKDVVVGIGHQPGRNYGEELARRGYIVLAPDILTAGERVFPGSEPYVTDAFDRDHPGWSMMGKMAWDHMRGVDLLTSLPDVDAQRIGAIGHSLGGYNAIWLAAFDPRIQTAVSSCGWASLGGAPNPFSFSRREWFVHIPSLRHYFSAGITPFDFHEVVALIAPRPFFNYSAREDQFFPNAEDIARKAAEVRTVYSFYGRESHYQFVLGEGEHDFPDSIREQAYAFLDRHLKGPVQPQPPQTASR